MVDVGRTIWQGCHTLRHDGIDESDYLDQMTMLLFLKMSSELGLNTTTSNEWSRLWNAPNNRILSLYSETLKGLSSSTGIAGEAFKDARSNFGRPESLRHIMGLLDAVVWTSLDRDVQGDAFEYLLEKAASGGKKGAGQYFTPRPLVTALVQCVKPGASEGDLRVGDPAAGTGGFLLAAYMWLKQQSGTDNPLGRIPRFEGTELVPRVRRLALMNLILHGMESPDIRVADALTSIPIEPQFDVIITNPPFGSKGGSVIKAGGYWYPTSSKQINFLQLIVNSLKDGGRAAVILPDNCFFGSHSERLWPELVEKCRVHTILRLPKGTFSPYTTGTLTNVVFFSKGDPTKETWIYDARTSFRRPTSTRPLRADELAEFVACFGENPNGNSYRTESDAAEGRWRRYPIEQLSDKSFDFNRLNLPTPSQRSAESHKDLLNQVEQDLIGALQDVRALAKVIDL
jgi:type I restriction enzyme M protein